MAAPVWVLSVDLQAKTAAFTTGLADAAKSARGSFNEIGAGAGEAGAKTGYSMMEARHGVMLLGEEFGIRLPRALSTFIASLGPIGATMEAAFPFLAIIALAGILIEHLEKMREAGVKLTQDQLAFGTAVQTVWNQLDEKILQAQIRADDLANNHVAALRHQIELLDRQSLDELTHAFETLAKDADDMLKKMEGHWYTFGKGSEGAMASLDEFKAHYESLVAAGRGDEASGLLRGTLAQAEKVQQLLQQRSFTPTNDTAANTAAYERAAAAAKELDALGISTGANVTKQLEAQQNLVAALQGQVGAEQRIADLKKLEAGNDKNQAGHEESGKAAAAARAAAESKQRVAEMGLASDKATAEAALTIHEASLETRLATDIAFAGRERDIKLAANQAEIAGLDRSSKDYENQLKALGEKTVEINAEYAGKVTELKAKESVEANSRDLQLLESSERDQVEATQQGSAARLAVLNAAISREEALGLESTAHYRELLAQRIEAARQAAEQEGKLGEEAARIDAENIQKSGELAVAAEKQRMALEESGRHVSMARQIADAQQIATEEYNVKMAAKDREIQGLDKSGKDYLNKLTQLQNEEKQLTKQHEDELTAITEKAEQQRNQTVLAAYTQFQSVIADSLTKSIMGHQTWAKMVDTLGDQVVSGMMENAIKSMLAEDMTKERDAASAARKAFNIGLSIGGPAGVILGPLFGAAAFTAVMAFAGGTDRVPGVGPGDTVPAMLTPGEGIVPGGVMDGLRNVARTGGFQNQGHTVHVHVRPTYHLQAIDGDGIRDVLEKHTDVLQQHFEKSVRRMNR